MGKQTEYSTGAAVISIASQGKGHGRRSYTPEHVFAGLCTAFDEAAIRGVHDAIGCRVGMDGIHEAKAAASLFSYAKRKGSVIKKIELTLGCHRCTPCLGLRENRPEMPIL